MWFNKCTFHTVRRGKIPSTPGRTDILPVSCDFRSRLGTTLQRKGITTNATGRGNGESDPTGVTSWSYHISIWILVAAGIIGNALVIVWRCSRKQSRLNLLSVLIVSLAFADLCFCFHFLLQEVMLASAIFGAHNQTSFSFTSVDNRFCLSIKLLADVSCCAIMLLVLAITLNTFFTFHHCRYGKRFIAGFVCSSWIVSLVTGAVGMWKLKEYTDSHLLNSRMKLGELSIIVIFGCVDLGLSVGSYSIITVLKATITCCLSHYPSRLAI